MNDIEQALIDKGYIPWFKSQIIRMGILDLLGGYGPGDLIRFLDSQKDLGGDLKALRRVAQVWTDSSQPFDVGESGTIYRFVSFYSWKNHIHRPIVMGGTLTNRVKKMGAGPEIVHWPLAKLLTLEGGTTQWATMAILMGNEEVLSEVPFYLQQTYDAKTHHFGRRHSGEVWIPQRDPTLIAQVREYVRFLETGKIHIWPDRLGDCDLACFLMAFGVMTPKDAKKIWPQIQYHESNRVREMKRTMPFYLEEPYFVRYCLWKIFGRRHIRSDDHRVVQAGAMRIQSMDLSAPISDIKKRFRDPDCVNKTWPRFWDALDAIRDFAQANIIPR
jgi:hypothetical protein